MTTVSVPMVLLGNKGDMVHLRQVATDEGNYRYKVFSDVPVIKPLLS